MSLADLELAKVASLLGFWDADTGSGEHNFAGRVELRVVAQCADGGVVMQLHVLGERPVAWITVSIGFTEELDEAMIMWCTWRPGYDGPVEGAGARGDPPTAPAGVSAGFDALRELAAAVSGPAAPEFDCAVCFGTKPGGERADTVVYACGGGVGPGHAGVCAACTRQCDTCPLCRAPRPGPDSPPAVAGARSCIIFIK